MKVKPTQTAGTILVELGPNEQAMPRVETAQASAPAPVLRLRNILVPIDFSDCSRKAVQYAVPFARQFGAELNLVYVAHPTYPVPYPGAVDLASVEPDNRVQDGLKLRAIAKHDIPGGIKTKVHVPVGHAADQIVELARVAGADLIIMATHGHTGLKHVMLGSTTESVVRRAPCPVLVVRQREHEFIQ